LSGRNWVLTVLYYTDYRFYQRFLENSWIFIEKNRDIWNMKHFQNSIVYYFLFYFLLFLISFFFSILPPYSCQKILKFFFYFMDPRFCQRILQNYGGFFLENLIYLKTKISPKFHNLLFFSNFFSIFCIFFFLFHLSKLDKKLFNFF